MMSRIGEMNYIIFLLLNIICFFIIEIRAYDVLETTIISENNEIIPLKFVKTEQLLANENLPIWTTFSFDLIQRDEYVMKDIGKFTTYHDLEKSAAVVYFEKLGCIYGTVDVRYKIICLPLTQLHFYQKINESPYVEKRTDNDNIPHMKPLDLSEEHSRSDDNRATNQLDYLTGLNILTFDVDDFSRTYLHLDNDINIGAPFTMRSYKLEKIEVYPEILMLIPYRMASTVTSVSDVVVACLVQLNSVGMLFAKLARHDMKIHINIAGIIIEVQENDFPAAVSDSNLLGKEILDAMSKYVKKVSYLYEPSRKLFSADSFDMMYIPTITPWQDISVNPGGISTEAYDMIENKRFVSNQKNRKILGMLVDGSEVWQVHVNVARQIAHLMTVQDDSVCGDLCKEGQCYGIMQKSDQHCPNCLIWSSKSIKQFATYFSENRNRCFLRNTPRSLYPFDVPLKSLIPADQCLCYGYYPVSHALTVLNRHRKRGICGRVLQCDYSYNFLNSKRNSRPLPIEGTPCNTVDSSKVCWERKCVSTLV